MRRLAGPQIVEDTVEFFRSLANIEAGLRQRAERKDMDERQRLRHSHAGGREQGVEADGLVEQLDGTISVTSEVNMGTTFTLRFPLAQARPSQLRAVLPGRAVGRTDEGPGACRHRAREGGTPPPTS